MSLKDTWINKIDNVDDVVADDINGIAAAVIALEEVSGETTVTLSDVRKSIAAIDTNLNKHISESEMLKNKGIANGYAPLDSNGLVPSKHLNNAVPHTTASGYPISLTDHLEGESVIDYKIYGNSIQDGTPSADNPIEIQSVGDLVTDTSSENYGKYDVPITICGKNLFDKNKSLSDSIKNETAAEYWGVVIYSGNIVADTFKANTTYTISFDVEVVSVPNSNDFTFKSGGFGFRLISKSNSLNMCYETLKLEQGKTYHRSSTFTIPDDLVYENMYFYANLYSKNSDNSSLCPQVIVRNIRIELGSAAPVTKHIYLDEPLRKVGDYADYIDYKNQSVVRQIEVLDSTGTKTIDESFGLFETPVTENITVPDLTISYSEGTDFNIGTSTLPSSMDVSYYQDINKVITELKNAILAQGGNV